MPWLVQLMALLNQVGNLFFMFDNLSSCFSSINYGCRGNSTLVSIVYSDVSLDICKLLYRDG